MHAKAHSNDFKHEFSDKDVTENRADLLQLTIVLIFVTSITVVCDGEHE